MQTQNLQGELAEATARIRELEEDGLRTSRDGSHDPFHSGESGFDEVDDDFYTDQQVN